MTSRRHNLNGSSSSSKLHEKLGSTLKKSSGIESPNKVPAWSKIVERKIIKQTVLKNAEGEKHDASLYQMKRASEAIKDFDIHMCLELERIKRPSPAVVHLA